MAAEQQSVVAEPIEETLKRQRTEKRAKPKRQPRYQVILWDDQEHTVTYVIVMMQQLFGHPPTKGHQIAEQVHFRGRAIVLTTTREHAELKRDQIHSYGGDRLVAECAGSMSSTIEPIES